MKIAISQSNYIPWKGYFDMIASVDSFILYDEVQYTKNDWRNRNQIMSKQGPQWITIPVKQHNLDQRIDETEIAQHNWATKHWKTLQANYGKHPFFKEYGPLFEAIYAKAKDLKKLSDINRLFIEAILEVLEIPTKLMWSTELDLQGDRNERLIDACLKTGANTYLSGPAAKIYLDENLFTDRNLSVEWMDYSGYKTYPQIGPEFQHGVSILDMIFNLGKETQAYMKFK